MFEEEEEKNSKKVFKREGVHEWLIKAPEDELVICAECKDEIPIKEAISTGFAISQKGVVFSFCCERCKISRTKIKGNQRTRPSRFVAYWAYIDRLLVWGILFCMSCMWFFHLRG